MMLSSSVYAQPQLSVGGTGQQMVFAQPGTTMTVAVSGGPANPLDWVGLFEIGAPDTHSSLAWSYLNGLQTAPTVGATSASLAFQAPATAGLYEFRFYRNNSFERLATSPPVLAPTADRALLVNNAAFPTVVTGIAGTSVRVDVLNGPANARDWVGLYPIGAPNQGSLDWAYSNGTRTPPSSGVRSATLTFALPVTGGSYEFRFFQNDGYTLLEKSTVVDVSSPAKLTLNGIDPPTSVSVVKNSTVTVGVSGGPANASDWVGLFVSGAADSNWTARQYLNGAGTPPTTGTAAAELTFATPANGGTYEFRFFAAGTFNRLTTSAPLLVNAPTAQLAVNSIVPPSVMTAAPGTTVSVQLSNGPGSPTDWVAMAATTAPNTTTISWKYLNGLTTAPAQGLTSATLSFTLPTTPGTYEFRFFGNNGYGRLATSSTITVTSSGVSIALVQPVAGASLTSPSSVTLAASVAATNRTVTQIDFYTGTTLIGTATSSPYQITWATPAAGAHTLTAVATDSTFATTTSGAVGITITGTLATPTATPPAGAYQPGQTVTLDGPTGTQIRYTTDGTVPTASSPLYSGPITLTQTTILKAKAFQTGWLTSPALVASYAIDNFGPSITATYNPKPNASGWNTTPVMLTFVCQDLSGVSQCPAPIEVSTEGANQPITVNATDVAGKVTIATFIVNIDMTEPSATITSPGNHSTTSSSTTTVQATLSDALSGIQSATCNGASASVTGGQLSCTVTLKKGQNAVIVQAIDVAGNARSSAIRVARIGTPSALNISPKNHVIAVGDTHTLKAPDDSGQPLAGLAWTSADPAIVTVDGDGRITGVAAGDTTVAAAAGSLQATVAVHVLTAGVVPVGTVRWSLGPSAGMALRETVGMYSLDGTVAATAEVSAATGAGDVVIRAFDASGNETKAITVPLAADESVSSMMGDVYGGIVLKVSSAAFSGQSLVRVTLDDDAGEAWRSQLFPSAVLGTAQSADGTIFAVSGGSIIGLDGATGNRKFAVATPLSSLRIISANCPSIPEVDEQKDSLVGTPTIDTQGRANVVVIRRDQRWDLSQSECWEMPPSLTNGDVSLYRISSSGTTSIQPLHEYIDQPYLFLFADSTNSGEDQKTLPDEEGGVLASWGECGGNSVCIRRLRHVSDASIGSEYSYDLGMRGESNFSNFNVPLISGSGKVAYRGGSRTVAFDMVTGEEFWSTSDWGVPFAARASGGAEVYGWDAQSSGYYNREV